MTGRQRLGEEEPGTGRRGEREAARAGTAEGQLDRRTDRQGEGLKEERERGAERGADRGFGERGKKIERESETREGGRQTQTGRK